MPPSPIKLVEQETLKLLEWAESVKEQEETIFRQAQILATRLGAHYRKDGLTEVGFWTPELTGETFKQQKIYLEIFTPLETFDWTKPEQIVSVRRDTVKLKQQGEFFWGVISGMKPGRKKSIGSFYWFRYFDHFGQVHTIRDLFPNSLPYGVFAPAELYDMHSLEKSRQDLTYFQETGVKAGEGDEIPRVDAPVSILQLHIGTASAEGTLAGLTKIYQAIAHKIKDKQPLTAIEKSYIGYDAIQLLPIEPTIEYRDDFTPESGIYVIPQEDMGASSRRIYSIQSFPLKLIKPNTHGWGYDTPIIGASTINPALLGSLRPDELVEFIATLHNFPTGPIKLIYDLVYGHADNQAELLINNQFFKGPNMYGQDLNHQLPMVRAILLEMQRRKLNTGADGIRVDGGQDFRFFNPLTGRVEQDDTYLLAMADVVQEIGGYQRLMFTIFEDGRPWPEEGWEEKSTYLDLVKLMPESYQWGPLIFAHNTPTLKGFWEYKWRRINEVMYQGQNWITGCGNHDTVRRGNQVDLNNPEIQLNNQWGDSLSEILHNAYDNPAVTSWVYGFSPGLPMDFINATLRAPWMFFRNTDERYGVKVASEEMGFLDWQITPEIYQQSWSFKRLKSLGFESLEQLKEFGHALAHSMEQKEYDLDDVVAACQACLEEDSPHSSCDITTPLAKLNRPDMVKFLENLNVNRLKQFAYMFMEDAYDACNVSFYKKSLKPGHAQFNLRLREFRHQNSWLRKNLMESDVFNKFTFGDRMVFYGVRSNPDNVDDQIAMVSHLEGNPVEVMLGDWLPLNPKEWKVMITSPDLKPRKDFQDLSCFELSHGQSVLLKRKKS